MDLGLDHFFRHQHGRVLAGLVRALGREHLDLAEDAVQEAFVRALRAWPLRGMPDDPAAWLLRTARNAALDALRRKARWRERAEVLAGRLEAADRVRARPADAARNADSNADSSAESTVVTDDTLRLMLLCCHPALPRVSRTALTLNLVSGFSAAEIARAFLIAEPAMAQRLVRAKTRLREEPELAALPEEGPALATEIEDRLDAVLDAVYLLFNAGYTPAEEAGSEVLRRDLVEEAIRLARLLARHPATDRPEVHALLALVLLQSSRLDARVDATGALLTLAQQDRGSWDKARVGEGVFHLLRSARGERVTELHLLAGIAAAHATAPDVASTDWKQICALYDDLTKANASPILALNRAVAISMADGPATGLTALRRLEREPTLREHHLLYAARADCLRRLDRIDEASAAYARAAALAPTSAERLFLEAAARDPRTMGAGPQPAPGGESLG